RVRRARARDGRSGIRAAYRAGGPLPRAARVHAGARRRTDRDGLPRGPGATARLTPTLLLALNFPPFGGGIARMMGEVARRYPARGLLVSTGTWPGSDPGEFPQTIDRVAVGAKRLRTLNGLVRWTRRAAQLARRTDPGFAWCDELKPAGYAAAWLHARREIGRAHV